MNTGKQRPQWLTFPTIRYDVEGKNSDAIQAYFADDYFVVADNDHLLADRMAGLPFLLDYTALIIVTKGWAEYTVNLTRHELCEGMLLLMNPRTIYQPERCSEDYHFDILVISDDLLSVVFTDEKPKCLWQELDTVVTLTDGIPRHMRTLFRSLLAIASESPQTEVAERHLIASIISYADSLCQSRQVRASGNMSREHVIFKDFVRLVSLHADHERSLDFYADKMCMSRSHLSITVSRHSGITARVWIERAVIMHAKVMLNHSTKTVVEISDALNFPNESFFSKYFKRLTGMSPTDYRRKIIG